VAGAAFLLAAIAGAAGGCVGDDPSPASVNGAPDADVPETAADSSPASDASGPVEDAAHGDACSDVPARKACTGSDLGALAETCSAGMWTDHACEPLSLAMGCAVRSNGGVVCWGDGGRGKLGNGKTDDALTPVEVTGITDAVQVSVGFLNVCAVRANGHIACWGRGTEGQLGNGSSEDSSVPVDVLSIDDAVEVSAGLNHACAVRKSGKVFCWGTNTNGVLGYGGATTDVKPTPVEVTGISSAISVRSTTSSSSGVHACALLAAGQIMCWGHDAAGELGDGAVGADKLEPVAVKDITGAVQVDVTASSTCARLASGEVKCWGSGGSGRCGDGNASEAPRLSPVTVSGLTDAKDIRLADQSACALRAAGQVVCWGYGTYGRLGNGFSDSQIAPVNVTGLTDAIAIAVGDATGCALRMNAEPVCWGLGNHGARGDGTLIETVATPVPMLWP
jgi:alpha-tubulin suppressor-like RCC1 family protein